jgi:AcrR family transcriptional regulator
MADPSLEEPPRGPERRRLSGAPDREAAADPATPEREGASAREATALARLPPGRHGLPRELVAANQRDRIAAGVIAAVTERGYQGAAVAHIVAAAGVSRRTFYGRHANRAEAFFDVYSEITDLLLAAMAEARASARGGWAAGVRAQLAALLGLLAENPDLARFCLAVPPAAGGEVAAAGRAFLGRLGEQLAEGMPRRARRPSPAERHGTVGGLAALVLLAAGSEEAYSLTALLPELTELVLAPYLGREAAARAAR